MARLQALEKFYKTRFRSSLYYTAVFNLNCLHIFFFKSFSLNFSSREKLQKRPSPVLGLLRLTTPPFSHPVRCKLRLHYARLTAGGIVDLRSKFRSRCATSFGWLLFAIKSFHSVFGWCGTPSVSHSLKASV